MYYIILKRNVFIFLIFPFICFGQSIDTYFTNVSLKDGLSQGVVYCIYQDKQKLMWFGTGDGLNRYDGYNFTVYKHISTDTTTISNSLINCITGDKSGNIWVGTTNGLNRYDPSTEQFTRYFHIPGSNSICDNYIKSLFIDPDEYLWIGTDDGLNRLDMSTGQITKYDFDGKLNNSRIFCIIKDSFGDMWLATRRSGLIRFNPETFSYRQYTHDPSDSRSISSDHVYTLYEDSNQQLWAGTWEYGVNRFVREKEEFDRLKTKKDSTGLNNEQIRCIIENEGKIWIGTFEGLNVYDPESNTFTYYQRQNNVVGSLSYNILDCMFRDHAGSIWIGTYGSGLDIYNPYSGQFKLFDPKANTNHNYGYIGPLVEHEGKIWIGTEGGGLASYDLNTKQYRFFELSDPIRDIPNSNTIRDLCVVRDNELWIGTYAAGIRIFNLKTLTFGDKYDKTNGIDNNIVNDIHEDNKGNIWVGSNSEIGIHLKDAGKKRFSAGVNIRTDEHENVPWVRAIYEPDSHELWFGSIYYGLYIYDKNRQEIKNLSMENSGLTSDYVSVITKDSKDRMWVGTYGGGINIMDKSGRIVSALTTSDGLLNDNICSIIEDSLANMWISTIAGISHYNPEDRVITNYSYQKGNFPIEILNLKSGLYASDGNIYFGGSDGLAYFSPKYIRQNQYIPPIIFTQLLLNNIPVNPMDETGILTQSIQQTPEITLKYNQTNITIGFAALNYIFPQNNQYMFYLDGYDKTWNVPNFQRYATYTSLPDGRYVFRVKASNDSGVWNDTGQTLVIRVLPPPWRTWWAYVLYFVVAVSIFYAVMHYFMSKVKLRNEIHLKQLEKKSLEETHQMRINLFTNFSHELRTPLTLILDPLKKILSDTNLPANYKDPLSLIYKNAKRILALVNQLMDFRKQESGNLKLKVQEGNLIKFISEIVIIFRELTYGKNIKLEFYHVEKEITAYYDQFLLEKVLYNILSNAIKNTPENGIIQVGIGIRNDHKVFKEISRKNLQHKMPEVSSYVEFIIKDNGTGIPEADLDKIFDPFFQVNEQTVQGIYGTGIGLYVSRGIVEMHHGIIWAESRPGEGATFKIILPVDRTLYKETEIADRSNAYAPDQDVAEIGSSSVVKLPASENAISPRRGVPIILVIDDNADIRAYIRSHLQNEFVIYEAENGIAGLEQARQLIPDLVISDIMMPRMDGLELTRTLKNDVKTNHIPVILLTARTTILQIKEGLNTGADDYLTKPFDADILKAKAKNIIENRKRLKEAYIRSFNIELPTQDITNIDEKFLTRAYDFVKKNIDNEELSIEEFGRQLSLSRTQLYRKIKALTGMSPSMFISTLRLKVAAELLLETNWSVSEIAYKVGFSNPSYFTTSFKRLYGVSPTEYVAAKKE